MGIKMVKFGDLRLRDVRQAMTIPLEEATMQIPRNLYVDWVSYSVTDYWLFEVPQKFSKLFLLLP